MVMDRVDETVVSHYYPMRNDLGISIPNIPAGAPDPVTIIVHGSTCELEIPECEKCGGNMVPHGLGHRCASCQHYSENGDYE